MKFLDNCYLIAVGIYRRLLILNFSASEPKPPVGFVRRTVILFCADNSKHRCGFPRRQTNLPSVFFIQRFNAQHNSAQIDEGRSAHRTFCRSGITPFSRMMSDHHCDASPRR